MSCFTLFELSTGQEDKLHSLLLSFHGTMTNFMSEEELHNQVLQTKHSVGTFKKLSVRECYEYITIMV